MLVLAWYDQFSLEVKDKLQEIYSKYDIKYDATLVRRPPVVPPGSKGKGKKLWG